jgi:cytochrome c oxidase subunit 4
MADTHHAHHAAPNVKLYLAIGVALAVFTAVSFVVNGFVAREVLHATHGFTIILAVAIVKAVLVGIYFMHLNHDWGKVGFMIVPAFILGAMMMFVLMPDIVLAWWGGE